MAFLRRLFGIVELMVGRPDPYPQFSEEENTDDLLQELERDANAFNKNARGRMIAFVIGTNYTPRPRMCMWRRIGPCRFRLHDITTTPDNMKISSSYPAEGLYNLRNNSVPMPASGLLIQSLHDDYGDVYGWEAVPADSNNILHNKILEELAQTGRY
jgi:hypothetical protein